jgi:hypothetical protein
MLWVLRDTAALAPDIGNGYQRMNPSTGPLCHRDLA